MAKQTRHHPITASDPSDMPLLLDPYQAAQALGINRSTLYALIQRDDFPSFTIGRRRCIPIKELEAWIARQLTSEVRSATQQ